LLLIDPETGQDLLNPVRGEWFEYKSKFTDGRIVELFRVSNRGPGTGDAADDTDEE
jgi:hypothetical protein